MPLYIIAETRSKPFDIQPALTYLIWYVVVEFGNAS
jgi:hypothetical protein